MLGPNGAGKSTLMRLLTLQQYPLATENREASIRLFGRDRWNVFELRSQMGIVSADLHDRFVHGNSNGVLRALDAVASGFFATLGVFAHQHVTDDMRARALEALDRVGAAALATRTLDTLSTGEARRVLIARALVHGPQVLVLDEPTRGLDLVARHAFMERVRDVARQGTTILLVTHYVEEIIPEIDRVVLLARGRIAFDGTKREVLTGPRLSHVFTSPLVVHEANGYYHIRIGS
jgi:iron complex transport system ATP-binding protein